MFTATASACAVGMQRLLQSFREHMHNPPLKFPISPFHFSCISLNSPKSKNSCVPISVNCNFYPAYLNSLLNFTQNSSASTISLTQDSTEDQTSHKVKFLCSFGGKIKPRRHDGNPHYVGGLTRIVAFHRDTTFDFFYYKMEEAYGGPVHICYQLPDHPDTLISVYSLDDFENMMDEFDCLLKTSGCGSTKLRVFLFPPFTLEDLSHCTISQRPNIKKGETYNVGGPSYINATNEVFASEANASRSHLKASTEHATSTINSNARGNNNISALEHRSFPIHSNVVDTKNIDTQIDGDIRRRQMHQQLHGATTSDSCLLYSDDDDIWKILGLDRGFS